MLLRPNGTSALTSQQKFAPVQLQSRQLHPCIRRQSSCTPMLTL